MPANNVLREKIAHRLTRPVGRPSLTKVKRIYEDFQYQAASWDKERRVIAKIEWHPGELFPKVGFIVTNLPMEPDWVVRFYNQRGTAEQHIKEGKYAFHWTRLCCKRFCDNEVRLQLHALAYNLATFLRCIELPEAMADWSLTSLQLKLIKIGARVVRHARAITFQLAEVAVTGAMVRTILSAILPPLSASVMRVTAIQVQNQQKRHKRSVRRAEYRRRPAKTPRGRRLIRPTPAARETADAARGEKHSFSRQVQPFLTSDNTPLGECRLIPSHETF